MPSYTYAGRDPYGKTVKGVLEGVSESDALNRLRERGVIISSIATAAPKVSLMERLNVSVAKVGLRDLAVFSKQFSAMVDGGLTMIKTLRILEKQSTNKRLQTILGEISQDVQSGTSLSSAMAKHLRIFSQLYVSMVRAGEESGTLDGTLRRLAEHLEKEVALHDQIVAASRYPTVIGVIVVAITTGILYYLVPQFKNIFDQLGGDLPLPTKMLVAMSNFIKSYWYLLLGLFLALPWAYHTYYSTATGRAVIDRLKLRLPVFGELIRKVSIARFSRTLSTLLSSGVPIIRALSIVEETAGNYVLEKAIQGVRNSLKEGQAISPPLEASGVFPMMVTSMVSVGEESGSLDGMLGKIADFYEAEVEAMVKGLTSLLEPILMVVMGVVVGGIVISLYLPMFKMVELVGKQ